jgi:hypothetical protein
VCAGGICPGSVAIRLFLKTVPVPKSAVAKECVVDGLITQRTTGQ